MAIINRYVNPASSAGGDGTTNNTTGATRAYATWAEWQTGEVTDLVAAGNIHQVNLSNGTDASTVDITGWTTSAASYIQINANENYLLAIPLVSNSIALKVDANFTKTLSANILYIQNTNSVTDSNARTNLEISATDCEIDNVIIIGENPSLGTNRIGLYVTGANNTVRNALIYGVGSTAGFPSSARVAGAGTLFVNVTAIGGSDVGYGIRANAADLLTCENCYSGNHGYNDYQGTMTQTKCYSDDSTGTVTGVLVNGTNFQNPATDDYTLPSGSALESAGDGPTVNSNVAAYDWQGLLRSGSTTSIGFDLVGAPSGDGGGGSSIPVIMNYYSQQRAS